METILKLVLVPEIFCEYGLKLVSCACTINVILINIAADRAFFKFTCFARVGKLRKVFRNSDLAREEVLRNRFRKNEEKIIREC